MRNLIIFILRTIWTELSRVNVLNKLLSLSYIVRLNLPISPLALIGFDQVRVVSQAENHHAQDDCEEIRKVGQDLYKDPELIDVLYVKWLVNIDALFTWKILLNISFASIDIHLHKVLQVHCKAVDNHWLVDNAWKEEEGHIQSLACWKSW